MARDISFEQALSTFQVAVATATGKAIQAASLLTRSATVEWASHLNNFAASTAQTLRRAYQKDPARAKKTLQSAAAWIREEASTYTAARNDLATVAGALEAAAVAMGKAIGKGGAAAGQAAAAALVEYVEEGPITDLPKKLAIVAAVLGGAYLLLRR